MTILDRKLARDLWSLRGQVFTIVLLVAVGVTILVGAAGTYVSLRATMEAYYAESRFADLWAEMRRAPRSLVGQLVAIPGIAAIEARIVEDVRVDWPRSELAVSGRIVSLPRGGQPGLNRLTLAAGNWPDPQRRDEVLINAAFAESWSVRPGDPLAAIVKGRRETFRVAGVAHSPEHVYAVRPGSPLPDDRTFVVLWAPEDVLAAAVDMEGAFNSAAVSLAPGASADAVIDALDRALAPYGAAGAYARRDQASHRFLDDELAEQRTLAVTIPVVFFAIAAFLLNVVLGRLVDAQREQIAALKALGYPSAPIGLHYAKLVAVISALGALLGIACGIGYGKLMLENYRPFFRFPVLAYTLPWWLPVVAALASLAAALAAALMAVRRVLAMAPVVAMRPPVPALRGHGIAVRRSRLGPRAKIVLRNVVGRPLRALLTTLGIALAVPLVVLGLFWWDALAYMVETHFDGIERGDAFVTFTDPVRGRAVRELAQVPGVLRAEGERIVAVRLRAAHRTYRLGLTGLAPGSELSVPRDERLRPVIPQPDGLTISRRLADLLAVAPGQTLVIEVLEGRRPVVELPIVALVDDVLGLGAYTDVATVNRLMREDDLVSHAALAIDPAQAAAAWRRLAEVPRIGAISVKRVWLQIFDEKIAGLVVFSAALLTAFGLVVAVGVVYNSARIAVQERVWELASLRILGFRRGEVARILLAELAVEMAVALPLGVLLAQVLVEALVAARSNESFHIPAVISAATFASAALVVLAAGIGSAILVRRRIDRLDLVGALKARE